MPSVKRKSIKFPIKFCRSTIHIGQKTDVKKLSQGTFNTTEKVFDGVDGVENLTGNEAKVLDCIRNDSSVSKKRISEITGISPRTVDRIIAELRIQNIIDRQGPDKGGIWVLAKSQK